MSKITTILGLAGGAVALVAITVTVTVHYVQPPQQEAVVQQVLEPKVLSCEEVQVFVNRFGKFEFKDLPSKVTAEIERIMATEPACVLEGHNWAFTGGGLQLGKTDAQQRWRSSVGTETRVDPRGGVSGRTWIGQSEKREAARLARIKAREGAEVEATQQAESVPTR